MKRLGLVSILFAVILANIASAKVYRYISIDSGGMLGVIPARILQDIEEKTEKPIHELVDGFIGTSTGAIIASLLSVDGQDLDRPHTAQEVIEFYKTRGTPIFSAAVESTIGNTVKKLMGQAPDYRKPAGELAKHTNFAFADRQMSQARRRLLVLSYDMKPGKMFTFDSHSHNFPLQDVVRASASISDAFGPTEVSIDGEKRSFIDAGSNGVRHPTNNPTRHLVEILEHELAANDECIIYSIGTGFTMGGEISSNNPNIKVLRLEPNVAHLSKSDMISKNLLASNTKPETVQAMITAAEDLILSSEYSDMLRDLGDVGQKTEL